MITQISRILGDTVVSFQKYTGILLKTLLFPVSVLLLLNFVISGEENAGLEILNIIIELIAYSLMAVTTHKIIILGPESISGWDFFIPSIRVLKFIAYLVLLSFLMLPIELLFATSRPGQIAAFLVISYIAGRLSLIFPALATDMPLSFEDAWQAGAQHQLVLFLVSVLLLTLSSVPEYIIGLPFLPKLLLAAVSLALTVVFLVILSVIFRQVFSADD